MTDKWLARAPVLWAMDEAPDVPAHLVAALIAVARYAGEDGRGAYPSVQTVATIIRKSDRNARKDLAELRQRGLLIAGDQRIVKDIRADKRPFVYDLAMPRGDIQVTPGKSRGVAHDTPHGGSHTTPRNGERGVAHDRAGGRTRPSGGSHTTPEEFLKNSRTGEPATAGADAAPPTPKPAAAAPEVVADRLAAIRASIGIKGKP